MSRAWEGRQVSHWVQASCQDTVEPLKGLCLAFQCNPQRRRWHVQCGHSMAMAMVLCIPYPFPHTAPPATSCVVRATAGHGHCCCVRYLAAVQLPPVSHHRTPVVSFGWQAVTPLRTTIATCLHAATYCPYTPFPYTPPNPWDPPTQARGCKAATTIHISTPVHAPTHIRYLRCLNAPIVPSLPPPRDSPPHVRGELGVEGRGHEDSLAHRHDHPLPAMRRRLLRRQRVLRQHLDVRPRRKHRWRTDEDRPEVFRAGGVTQQLYTDV